MYKEIPTNIKCVYFWFPILCKNHTQCLRLQEELKRYSIGFRYRYHTPLHTQPIFHKYSYQINESMSVSERLAGSVIGLPNYPALNKTELLHVCEIVNKFFDKEKK